MGYQERDYYRDDRGGGSLWSTMSVTTKLIVLNVAVFVADLFVGQQGDLTRMLALSPASVAKPWMWWQFLSAGFTHASPLHLFGNMIGLYFFGRPLEERFGGREFLRFYLIAILLGNIAWGVRQAYLVGPGAGGLVGASGGVTACVVLFCVLFPRATVLGGLVLPIPAWLFGLIIVGGDLFSMAQNSQAQTHVAYDVHLLGALFAVGYWYFGWNFRWIPGLSNFTRTSRGSGRWFKPRPDLRVHEPDEEEETPEYDNLDAEADRILEKVHRQGENSLTATERRTLEDYSRRMRQKLR